MNMYQRHIFFFLVLEFSLKDNWLFKANVVSLHWRSVIYVEEKCAATLASRMVWGYESILKGRVT